ncbi:hypothetical protein GCG54_00007963 [Colletotrichum gloeosporioides]|uniref:Uncharacterized protein n=1 Tax=Colletotrichum gloeosporioides TaxID=474922 RepID=A0A8H4C5N7_COLGL|nr:uncharacterized protein GCG54_00007963 [Colletotrichum gloeosporioides]KAF3797910.1 hypothetical protein GCG54_00007963 [Colletotrichum gloeosporioides]
MATHQNTFSVISNGAPGGAPSRPPMTSKQAQKLYKQANKVPRRSKAEQRKWEKERQEEIKKELERERAAVKAKQARDRKKAKEEEARENRRRQGQPLIDCRPSQDTIARFVRGNGTSRKRDSSGEPIPETEKPNVATATKLADRAPTSSQSTRSPRSAASQERRISIPPPPRPSQKFKSKPSAPTTSQFKTPPVLKTNPVQAPRPPPVFKAPVINPDQAESTDPTPLENRPKPPTKLRTKRFMMPKGLLPGQQPTNLKPVKQEKQDSVKQEPIKQEDVRREAVKKKADTAQLGDQKPLGPRAPTPKPTECKKGEGKPLKPPIPAEPTPVETSNYGIKRVAEGQMEQGGNEQEPVQHGLAKQMLVERTQAVEPSQMPPPPIPSPPRSTSLMPPPNMPPPPIPRSRMTPPKVRSSHAPSPQELSPQRPPPSTQAIIQDCFDDFFPTASQLALELEDGEPNESSQAFAQSSLKKYESPRFTSSENSLLERTQPHVPTRPVISDMASRQAKKPRTEGGFESHKSSRDSRTTAKPSSARFTSVHHTPQSELPTTTKNQTPDPKQRGNQRYTQKPDKGLLGRATFGRPAPTKPTPFREYSQTITNPTRNDHLHRTPITPKPRGILQEVSRNRIPQPKPPAAAKPVFDDFFPLICTQDLMMSSQEVLEIESPAKVNSEPSSGGSLGGPEYQPSPLIEMDLAAIDWDDDLDDF